MIKPTVGRVVWYWPKKNEAKSDQPLAAIVCHVWDDNKVNLSVFGYNGEQEGLPNVFLYQGDTDRPEGDFAEWMPYQIGQAKKESV